MGTVVGDASGWLLGALRAVRSVSPGDWNRDAAKAARPAFEEDSLCRRSARLTALLQQHIKQRLAPCKYPRWIEFVGELPRTATGKIQRFKLRG